MMFSLKIHFQSVLLLDEAGHEVIKGACQGGITKRWTGQENRMGWKTELKNGMENGKIVSNPY